jgi:hypothetical protein
MVKKMKIIDDLQQIIKYLISTNIKLGDNHQFYIKSKNCYEFISDNEIKSLLANKGILVTLKSIIEVKKYYPITIINKNLIKFNNGFLDTQTYIFYKFKK